MGRYFSSVWKPTRVCILRHLLYSYRGIFPPLWLFVATFKCFPHSLRGLSERRREEPLASESLFGRDGCQSIWAEMEKSPSCHKQRPLLSLPSRRTVPCRANGGERRGRSKKKERGKKTFQIKPSNERRRGGRVKRNEGRERENKDRLFHHL